MDSNYSVGGSNRSWSFTETMDGFRVIEIPFSPLTPRAAHHDNNKDKDDLFISPRDYGSRQAFLRSYTFTRADHPPTPQHGLEEKQAGKARNNEKMTKSLLRLKAVAWAVVACQYRPEYRVPLRARLFKDKLVIKTSQYLSTGVQCLRSPPMPHCLMAGA